MKLRSTQERNEIIEEVCNLYGGRKIELDYTTPFQLLCAVMLSAQTTDKQVNKTTPPLFALVKEPQDMPWFTVDDIAEKIQSINYYKNKAKYLRATAQLLVSKYDSSIPNTLAEMILLPGVGIKTAKVVLAVLYNLPLVWVDTHIHRVCNRIGLLKSKDPLGTDAIIEKRFSIEQKLKMHHPFVLFGRYTCVASRPKCEKCPLTKKCNYYIQENPEK